MSQVRSGHLNRLRRFTVFGEGVQVLGVAGQELDQVGPLDLLRHSLVQQLDVVGEVVVVGVVGAGDLFEVVRTVGVRKAYQTISFYFLEYIFPFKINTTLLLAVSSSRP